jgi:hypothetical protein
LIASDTHTEEAAMYVYQDQSAGWSLQPKTNSPISYVKHWDAFRRTYRTREDACAAMSAIWKEEGR